MNLSDFSHEMQEVYVLANGACDKLQSISLHFSQKNTLNLPIQSCIKG
jgi:hypothetical protein